MTYAILTPTGQTLATMPCYKAAKKLAAELGARVREVRG